MPIEKKNKTNRINITGNNRESRWSRKKRINLTANNCVNCFAGKIKFVKIVVKYSYINKLNGKVANFQPQRISDCEYEHFYDAAVQQENSYYDPVAENINKCMYEGEKVRQHKRKHKKLCFRSFKHGIIRTLCFRIEA